VIDVLGAKVTVLVGVPVIDEGTPASVGASLMKVTLTVEVAVPVEDPGLRARLDEILQVTFADDVLSWELRPDGGWSKIATVNGLDAQETLMGLATARAKEAR